MENLNSIIKRIKAETPVFWKKVRRIMVAAGAVGTGIVALPAEYISFLPANTGGFLITVGVVGTALSSMTVKPGSNEPTN